ncbi:PLD nuclease N-terminal domain-containing protein [uncultured Jatrophihabitans sp.]|uniref:PLD nuclease N-terminal domain-containing protein n=1 Tax=uncultured Jatrophihabitans sp. TaxID=1610747 RepID=UPI0035CC3ACF
MLYFDGGIGILLFGLWVFCIIDVITTPDGATRNLPKLMWLLIVIILPDVGSIAWLVAGRPWQGANAGLPYKGNRGRPAAPAAARPADARSGTRARATNPDDDEEFLAGLRARAEEQRRRGREAGRDEPPAVAD